VPAALPKAVVVESAVDLRMAALGGREHKLVAIAVSQSAAPYSHAPRLF